MHTRLRNLLAERRIAAGLTQACLGERIGIDGRRICELETRLLPARVEVLKRLANALGCKLDDLVDAPGDLRK